MTFLVTLEQSEWLRDVILLPLQDGRTYPPLPPPRLPTIVIRFCRNLSCKKEFQTTRFNKYFCDIKCRNRHHSRRKHEKARTLVKMMKLSKKLFVAEVFL